ncbi:hypothetical protein M2T72_29750, partial [Klebsiella pneumoniae]|nr:hypothetical protein [Klebsiella pneumoniae]
FAGKKSAQIREILISESAWEEMTCLFAPSLGTHKPEKKGFLLIYHKCTHIVLSITPQPPRRSQKTLPQRTTFFYLN